MSVHLLEGLVDPDAGDLGARARLLGSASSEAPSPLPIDRVLARWFGARPAGLRPARGRHDPDR